MKHEESHLLKGLFNALLIETLAIIVLIGIGNIISLI